MNEIPSPSNGKPISIKVIRDDRGALMVGEFEREIPFSVKRFFIVYDVPGSSLRGIHAHKQCHQFLICTRGSCTVLVDDGKTRVCYELNAGGLGVYMPPLTWGNQSNWSTDAMLLVFASHYYDPDDYVRDYDEFLLLVKGPSIRNGPC